LKLIKATCIGLLFAASKLKLQHTFSSSLILETYIAPLQETTTQRRSQPSQLATTFQIYFHYENIRLYNMTALL